MREKKREREIEIEKKRETVWSVPDGDSFTFNNNDCLAKQSKVTSKYRSTRTESGKGRGRGRARDGGLGGPWPCPSGSAGGAGSGSRHRTSLLTQALYRVMSALITHFTH